MCLIRASFVRLMLSLQIERSKNLIDRAFWTFMKCLTPEYPRCSFVLHAINVALVTTIKFGTCNGVSIWYISNTPVKKILRTS